MDSIPFYGIYRFLNTRYRSLNETPNQKKRADKQIQEMA